MKLFPLYSLLAYNNVLKLFLSGAKKYHLFPIYSRKPPYIQIAFAVTKKPILAVQKVLQTISTYAFNNGAAQFAVSVYILPIKTHS